MDDATYSVTQNDKTVLRALADQVAEIAQDPVNGERRRLWRKLNDLSAERPMIWYNDIPWHELNADGELDLLCTSEYGKTLETGLRRTRYQWRHFSGDMVVNPWLDCPKVYTNTLFGIDERADIIATEPESDIVSRHFHAQIHDEDDLEKIKMPVVTFRPQESAAALSAMQELFDGILPVRQQGETIIWYTPWDYLVRWWGVEQALIDLIDRPALVHAAYRRMVDGWMTLLDQLEAQALLARNDTNCQVGSGAYGYVSDLPGAPCDPGHVVAHHTWGCANAQILSSVSPQMHWDFALAHDLRWLERFGLTYYGCCEPLDGKVDILRKIPNLRKISISAWADPERAAAEIGKDYVLSRKPSPAVLAGAAFAREEAAADLRTFYQCTKTLNVEYIMKDISTVGHDPRRLWAWDALAKRILT